MPKFNYDAAKEEIAQIVAIAQTCPEPLREKCFELLFQAVFSGASLVKKGAPAAEQEEQQPPPPGATPPKEKKLQPNVRVLMHRHDISQEQLDKLFLLDHEPMLSVYKVPTGNVAKGQLYKVMMVLLENGLLNNQLTAPYPELRENLREDGLYDGNFNKLLKRNHDLFKGAVSKDAITEDATVELTGAGMARMAEIIKELAAG